MFAYIIQEKSSVDHKWHQINVKSAPSGIYLDRDQALAVYDLFKRFATFPNHIRLITCWLEICASDANLDVNNSNLALIHTA